jgi:hypothetical protein
VKDVTRPASAHRQWQAYFRSSNCTVTKLPVGGLLPSGERGRGGDEDLLLSIEGSFPYFLSEAVSATNHQ